MKKVIFLPTIQHTGTWFTMECLKVHPEIDAMIEMHVLGLHSIKGALNPSTLFEDEYFSEAGHTILHMHLPLWGDEIQYSSCCGVRPDATLFVAMTCACPTVIPLRDPLLCIISAANRRSRNKGKYDISFLVDVWAQMVRDMTLHNEISHPYYWPVDLLTVSAQTYRIESMKKMFKHLGFTWVPDTETEHKMGWFCRDWPLTRPTLSSKQIEKGFEYRKKISYADGDITYLERMLPKEMGKLRSHEPLLRPFLENIGYKDLLWWTR